MHAPRALRARSIWNGISITQIIAQIEHSLAPVRFNQSPDAIALIGDHRWKQLKSEFSAAVAQAMRFGDSALATVLEN